MQDEEVVTTSKRLPLCTIDTKGKDCIAGLLTFETWDWVRTDALVRGTVRSDERVREKNNVWMNEWKEEVEGEASEITDPLPIGDQTSRETSHAFLHHHPSFHSDGLVY